MSSDQLSEAATWCRQHRSGCLCSTSINASPSKRHEPAIQNTQNDTPSNSGCYIRIVPLDVLACHYIDTAIPAPASGASAAAGAYSGRGPIKPPCHCPPSEHAVPDLQALQLSRISGLSDSLSVPPACMLAALSRCVRGRRCPSALPSALAGQTTTPPALGVHSFATINMAATPTRKHVFLDFDGTVTKADTITALAQFALDTQSSRGSDLSSAWDRVVEAYLAGCKAYAEGHHTPASLRTEVEQEVEFLRQMKASEMASLERIRECQVFRGISADEFRQAGRDLVGRGVITLRDGFHEYVRRRADEGCKVWVLSVNWSTAFIEGACHPSVVSVIANNVSSEGSIVGPELFLSPRSADHGTLTNSVDKLNAMRAALLGEGEGPTRTVYMGDSVTDMECLLAADEGVVMSDKNDSALLETLRRIGNQVEHVGADKRSDSGIVWASSFVEIEKKGERETSTAQ